MKTVLKIDREREIEREKEKEKERERTKEDEHDMQPLTKCANCRSSALGFLSACARLLTCLVSVTNARIRPPREESTCVVCTNCVAPPGSANDCGSRTCSHTTDIDDGIELVRLRVEVSY